MLPKFDVAKATGGFGKVAVREFKGVEVDGRAAAVAKKALDDVIAKQQKPAETKLAVAKKATGIAITAKIAADKALTTANAATVNARKAFEAVDKAAKGAEASAKKIAGDPKKNKEEKNAASKVATDMRKLASTAKTKLAQKQAEEKTAQTAATTAAINLTQTKAAQKLAETVLVTANANVANGRKVSAAADRAGLNLLLELVTPGDSAPTLIHSLEVIREDGPRKVATKPQTR